MSPKLKLNENSVSAKDSIENKIRAKVKEIDKKADELKKNLKT